MLTLDASGAAVTQRKISALEGGFSGALDDFDLFGRSVAALGDVDGDGIGDLAVGAFADDDGGLDQGAVWICFLHADGTVRAEQKISATAGGLTGPLSPEDYFGRGVAGLGDLDGDGTPDLAVAADADDTAGNSAGRAWMLTLTPLGTVESELSITEGLGGFTGDLDPGDAFGFGLAGPGDLDGDGVADLLVGAFGDDDGAGDTGALWSLSLDGIPAPSAYGCTGPPGSLLVLDGAAAPGASVVIGVHNPLATQPPGALPLLALALTPAPGFPCGTPLPGWGMAGPGAVGELLVSPLPPNPLLLLAGSPWTGTPSPFPLAVPSDPSLVGTALFLQGVLIAPGAGVEIGATEGLELVIGL